LRVAVFETGAGETCLMLHGYPQNHDCWAEPARLLSGSYRLIAVDWFGWGASERSFSVAPRYEEEVARLGRLLDALGLAKTNLFAHDYGSFLALGFASRSPERLLRLAILNSRAQSTFPWLSYLQFGAFSWLACNALLRPILDVLPIYDIHRRSMQRYIRNGSFTHEQLESYIGWMRTPAGKGWLEHFFRHYQVRERPELRAGARTIDVPAAVIWGDADPFCPFPIAEELASLLPQATLTRIAGGDHYVMEERPLEVHAALRALLDRPS